MSLSFNVFAVDPKPIPSAVPGFEQAMGTATWPPSTSTLISDDDGAMLIDCLITKQEGRELAAWVKSLGPELTYVYITHPHADHFYGLPEILAAFPQAKPVALAESVPAMQEQASPGYLQAWNGFFPGQLTSEPVAPGPLEGTAIPVGGSPAKDDDARRQISESRRYIADFEQGLEDSSTPAELIDRMMKAYPDLANPYTLWIAAHDQLGAGT
jgi:glyoxylase-like metal-dependent hydrolase (beta-lactamase superfamily II)